MYFHFLFLVFEFVFLFFYFPCFFSSQSCSELEYRSEFDFTSHPINRHLTSLLAEISCITAACYLSPAKHYQAIYLFIYLFISEATNYRQINRLIVLFPFFVFAMKFEEKKENR
uniref:Uncharacterized protein n=1 Tax=Octopus bimaculoides TaxID=37653 RepID=A0A0L8HY32_OCTBM